MIVFFSKRLNGFLVMKHREFGLSLLACDKNRIVAISKALNRI